MAYCPECGNRLDDGARFCAACGHGASEAATLAVAAAKSASEMVMHDVQAPASAGESVISTWAGAGESDASAKTTTAATAAAAATAARQAAVVADGISQATEAHRQSVEGPSVHYSSSRGGVVPVARKKSRLPLVIGGVVAVAVVAVLALYVVPLFVPHPVDPHANLTSPAASSQGTGSAASSASTADGAPSNAASADAGAASIGSASSGAAGSVSDSPSAASGGDTAQVAAPSSGFSTSEWPTLAEFTWLTGEAAKGNVPAGATRLADLGAVTGGWKAYLYDSDMERLLHVSIEVGQSDVVVAFDWYYAREGATGQSHEDTTPTSFFSGTWDSGMLDAVGSGRVTLAAFWQQDDRQYATGSLMWPDGSVSTLALVRP